MSETAVLQLQCLDQKCIVFRVSQLLVERGGNIINLQQHSEELDRRFFMRVHFDFGIMNCTRSGLRADLERVAAEFSMETRLSFSDERKRMAILVSKTDHCLYELLLRHQYGEINADIACIISNHRDLEGIAKQFRIPYFYTPITPETRQAGEERQLEILDQHHVDFVVLARYMQILTPRLIDPYANRIINIHHGFLPAFKGSRPYHQAYERGVKLIGATAHYATEELDDGPIIEQQTLRVSHIHSANALIALGREIEREVLSRAVAAHAEDRVLIYKKRTIVFA